MCIRDRGVARIEREGQTKVRTAKLPVYSLEGGKVTLRVLADGRDEQKQTQADGTQTDGRQTDGTRIDAASSATNAVGAETHTDVFIAHVELDGVGTAHELALPDGWTCIAYVRKGTVGFGGEGDAEASIAQMYDTAYFGRSGVLRLTCLENEACDVMVFAGAPIGAPVAAQGTMVMNTQGEVQRAVDDYQRGLFGQPWEHTLKDDEWLNVCQARRR